MSIWPGSPIKQNTARKLRGDLGSEKHAHNKLKWKRSMKASTQSCYPKEYATRTTSVNYSLALRWR